MANSPKYVRRTAKSHAQANRQGDVYGKGGERTTRTSEAWPKRFPTTSDQKAAEYVPRYTERHGIPRQFNK
jgi:hypothetical protein